LLFLPLWWNEVTRVAGDASSFLVVAYKVRAATTAYEDSIGSVVANYLVAGLILMPVLLIGRARGQISLPLLIVTVVPWLVANLVANGRGSLLQFVIASGYAVHMQAGRIRKTTALGLVGIFLLVFVGGILLVGKEGVTETSGLADVGEAALQNFFGYLLQGSVLFGKYMAGVVDVAPRWDALSFFCIAGSKLGLCVPADLHLDFNAYRPDGAWGNVYSVYFSIYPNYGMMGVVAFMALYGAWTSLHHEGAARSLAHTLVAAYLVSSIVN
jgi:oligosaccharide repeat unit polymerase